MRKDTARRKRRRISVAAGIVAAALLWCVVPPLAAADPADTLLGDIGELRTALDRHGIAFELSEISEVFSNLTGGVHRGFEYAGLTKMHFKIGTNQAFGWAGGEFDVSALQIHGRNLSADNLAVLQTISNIDADRATRLWELWYRQRFLDGKMELKLGQQSLDADFLVSDYAGLFINAMNGFPTLPANDLYAGGPVFPLSSLGIRLQAKPAQPVTVLAGIFDDNPPGGPFFDDSQLRDGEASGTRFNLGTGAIVLGEIQYAVARPPFAGRHVQLPGTYKLGVWVDSGRFPDQRFDTAGLSLAAPTSTGVARLDHGNFSVYGILDQMIWRLNPKADQSLGAFIRAMGAPGDRNLVDFALNAGIVLHAPLPDRPNDAFGIAYGLAEISGRAAALDRDRVFFTGLPFPVRSHEQIIEVTYQWQLAPWWQLQPDFQYVFNPGGGAGNRNEAGRRLGNEAVLGLRTLITF